MRIILVTNRNIEKADGFDVTIPINNLPVDMPLKTALRMRPDAVYTDDKSCYDYARSIGCDINYYAPTHKFTVELALDDKQTEFLKALAEYDNLSIENELNAMLEMEFQHEYEMYKGGELL